MLQPETLFDNRYELIRLLGRGGFAEVWLVKDNLTGLEEALKIYAPGGGMDEDGLKIFAQELTVVHDLRHTNLLTPKTMGQCDHQPYLVLPYCPNGSLNKKIGKCTEDEAWKILEQVAAGLAYLHERDIMHQDIKPDNILVDANNDCVITDFGISLKAQSTLRKSVRQANLESGTMAYMAPERFSENPFPIPANDVWSLGAMMFELMEGNVPFLAQMGGLAQMNGAKIPTMHGEADNNLKQVILAMLSANPEERPTAKQLVELARTKSAPAPTVDVKPEPEPEPKPKSKSKQKTIEPKVPAEPVEEKPEQPRQSTVRITREPAKKPVNRNMLIAIISCAVVIIAGSVIVGIMQHQKAEQQRIERVRADYTAKYRAICDKCAEHLRMVDDDRFFLNFIEIARDLRDMQVYEGQKPFVDFGLEAQSYDYMNQYCEKIQSTRQSLQSEMRVEKAINPSPENTILVNIRKKLDLLDKLFEQAKTGDASRFQLPEDKKQENVIDTLNIK